MGNRKKIHNDFLDDRRTVILPDGVEISLKEATERFSPWSDPTSDPLGDLERFADKYREQNNIQGEIRVQMSDETKDRLTKIINSGSIMPTPPQLEMIYGSDTNVPTNKVYVGGRTFDDELDLVAELHLPENPAEWPLPELLKVIAAYMHPSTVVNSPWRQGFRDFIEGKTLLDPGMSVPTFKRMYTQGWEVSKVLTERLYEGAYAWEGG